MFALRVFCRKYFKLLKYREFTPTKIFAHLLSDALFGYVGLSTIAVATPRYMSVATSTGPRTSYGKYLTPSNESSWYRFANSIIRTAYFFSLSAPNDQGFLSTHKTFISAAPLSMYSTGT